MRNKEKTYGNGLRGTANSSRVDGNVDGLEDFGRRADTVSLAVGAGTLTGSFADLFYQELEQFGLVS